MHPKSVVVVEDDPEILSLTASIFEEADVRVVSFGSADDALAYLYDNASDVAAVFTDLQMPGRIDGLVLAEIVGRHWPGVTVILTSGRVSPMGALPRNTRFILKPWSAAVVLAELQAAVDAARGAVTL